MNFQMKSKNIRQQIQLHYRKEIKLHHEIKPIPKIIKYIGLKQIY